METVIGTLFDVFFFFAVVICFASFINFLAFFGYVLIRVILKLLGLHSATPEQWRRELKFACISGIIFFIALLLVAIIDWIDIATGAVH